MAKSETDEEKAERELKEAQEKAAIARVVEMNAGRTGKGTRAGFNWTRGRSSSLFYYEAFDESQPDTCPATTSEFLDLTKIQDDKILVSYLIAGYNDAAIANASDPVNEFIEPSWSPEVAKGFKLVVKNYAANVGVSIEDAAGLIKPAYLKSQEKK
jgi:hypothetical protein